jgi:ABC-type protease/lipase transport system fused ATPase/permease subunit
LVIERATSPGAIFAASLLLGRALQPVEQIIGQWQSLLSARSTFARLQALLEAHPAPAVITSASTARPAGRLIAHEAGLSLPGLPAPLLQGASFHIQPGESVGLIGPSGAGKSTLVRLMVGAVEPSEGSVQLAGVDVPRLFQLAGGSPIGYMPQEVELFGETIAANISRFGTASREEIERAAHIAGAHDMIMSLPKGYLTHLGEGGSVLSGGMRQRIALARAVFGNPSLVVLDEPSSNLDNVGDAALAACIRYLQTQGTTVVMVSHRPVTTALMQKFIVVIDGRVQAFGSREEVVRRLSGGRPSSRRVNAVMESGVEPAHRMSA